MGVFYTLAWLQEPAFIVRGQQKQKAEETLLEKGFQPGPSAALPRVCPILSHQEVDLASHLHVVYSPAGFIALSLPPAAWLLIVAPPFDALSEPIHGEDPVEGPVGALHVALLHHHGPGEEPQVLRHAGPGLGDTEQRTVKAGTREKPLGRPRPAVTPSGKRVWRLHRETRRAPRAQWRRK